MNLDDILKHIDGDKLPPVHLWEPDFCGDIDMVIKSDGTWFYLGTPIGRKRMVKLFSRVLRRDDDGKYYLVTPVEKIGITVEDAPFITTFVDFLDGEGGPSIVFETNVGDKVIAGKDNPITVVYEGNDGEPAPYVLVRDRLKAKISRNNFYDLVEHASDEGDKLIVMSQGESFCLGSISE